MFGDGAHDVGEVLVVAVEDDRTAHSHSSSVFIFLNSLLFPFAFELFWRLFSVDNKIAEKAKGLESGERRKALWGKGEIHQS